MRAILEGIRLALRSIARSPLRASLTVLGILIGVAAVVIVTALGAGARDRVATPAESLSAAGISAVHPKQFPGPHQQHDQHRGGAAPDRGGPSIGTLNGSFNYSGTDLRNPNLFGFVDTGSNTGMNANVSWRHIFTREFTGVLNYNFSRYSGSNTPYFANRQNIAGRPASPATTRTPPIGDRPT